MNAQTVQRDRWETRGPVRRSEALRGVQNIMAVKNLKDET